MGDLARSVPVKGKSKRSGLRLSILSCVPYYSVDKALLSPFTLFIPLFLNKAKNVFLDVPLAASTVQKRIAQLLSQDTSS